MYSQIGILGKTGYGKTHLTKKLIENITRKIIIDAHDQFNEIDRFFKAYSIDEFIHKISEKNSFSISCTFDDYSEYEKLLLLCWNIENYLLVIDEISIYAESHTIDENLKNIVDTSGFFRIL